MKTKDHIFTLRKLGAAEVALYPTYNELPPVFAGTERECSAYAILHGYPEFKADQSLFGGYYVNQVGDCLIPT